MEIQPQETNPIATPKDIALQGTYLCLPHKDISGPQTLECALVIKTDDDAYYALDLNQLSEFPAHISMGERISVQGIMIPIEQLSSDHWQKYPITGIFTVTDPIN